jgi:signal peptidase I
VKSKSTLLHLLLMTAVGLVTFFLVTYSFFTISVDGTSMEPTLEDGDRPFFRKHHELVTNDVVVFPIPEAWAELNGDSPPKFLIKRLIAAPGDKLAFDGEAFSVNGKEVFEVDPNWCLGKPFKHTLGEDEMFVAGDNAKISFDSRRLFCDGYDGYLVSASTVKYNGVILFHLWS